jgi:hypothetical protein
MKKFKKKFEEVISKLKKCLQNEGVIATAIKIIYYPINLVKKKRFVKILSLKSNEDKFTWIYKKNYWSCKESFSGPGSTLKYTKNLRNELPNLFRRYSIQKIFDAPCGDFNWMSHLLPLIKLQYIGGDIVKPLIDSLNINYKSARISFVHFDLISEIPPKVDLMICRDFLFHLSFQDTKSVLENYIESKSTYLLTTTHKNMGSSFSNQDILTGDFRCIDLFSKPYNFPTNPLYVIEDWVFPDPERQMCLWSKEQILLALRTF